MPKRSIDDILSEIPEWEPLSDDEDGPYEPTENDLLWDEYQTARKQLVDAEKLVQEMKEKVQKLWDQLEANDALYTPTSPQYTPGGEDDD